MVFQPLKLGGQVKFRWYALIRLQIKKAFEGLKNKFARLPTPHWNIIAIQLLVSTLINHWYTISYIHSQTRYTSIRYTSRIPTILKHQYTKPGSNSRSYLLLLYTDVYQIVIARQHPPPLDSDIGLNRDPFDRNTPHLRTPRRFTK